MKRNVLWLPLCLFVGCAAAPNEKNKTDDTVDFDAACKQMATCSIPVDETCAADNEADLAAAADSDDAACRDYAKQIADTLACFSEVKSEDDCQPCSDQYLAAIERPGVLTCQFGFKQPTPPPAWTCCPESFGDGVDCDCGCGALDFDCDGSAPPSGDNAVGCETVGCEADACDVNHTAEEVCE